MKRLIIILAIIIACWPCNVQAADNPAMIIKFNPTGTQVDSQNNLKIRLDFYPQSGCKSYNTYLIKNATTGDYLTPCLNHFITVKPDILQSDLDSYVKSLFTADALATIDSNSIQNNSAHLLSPYMRDKSTTTDQKINTQFTNIPLLTSIVNTRLSNYSFNTSTGQSQGVRHQSIDIGTGAVDANFQASGYTWVAKGNTANAGGTLDTFEIWANTNETGCEAATFYVVSGNNLSTRGTATIGSVTAGSKQTFTGLSISVNTGDYLGMYAATGNQEYATSGGVGTWYKTGDNIPATNAAFTSYAGSSVSIYATGVEASTYIPQIWWWQ